MEIVINNIDDLFVTYGREMLRVTQIELKELPKVIGRVTDSDLKRILSHQLLVTRELKLCLTAFYREREISNKEETINWNSHIFSRIRNLLVQCKNPVVDDAFIIYPLKQMNFHLITMLCNLRVLALELKLKSIAQEINELLEAQEQIDAELSAVQICEAYEEFDEELVVNQI